jgi:predicted ATPase
MAEADGVIGRDAELTSAAAAVSEVSLGRASILVIEGEAGIGKTRLVQSIVDDARAADVTVFHGHAHPFERTRPLGVVADALGLHRRATDPTKAAIGSRLTGKGLAAESAGDFRFQVVEQIVDLVETSCRERPVLLVAEDVHWADTASLSAISSVARQLPLSPLLVVVTARPSPLSTEAARLLDDLSAAGARTLELRPLAPDDVVALARHALGAPPGDELRALLAKAGGNPLWVVAMLGALDAEGLLQRTGPCVDATTSDLPASLHALVVRRLRHLPKATRDLLQVAAVLGDDVALRDVATVTHRSPTDVVAELDDAFEAQLLDETEDRVVFRHQVVHDAIYQHVPAPSRRILHREAAIALTAAGADRLDVARHLMLGAERGDDRMIAALRDCAREAATRSPDLAVELVRRAEALLPGGHDDADLVSLEVMDALLRAGKVADVSARAEAVLIFRATSQKTCLAVVLGESDWAEILDRKDH